MAERQEVHRIGLEQKALTSQTKNERLGMVLGFVIVVAVLAASVYIISIGQELAGLGIILTELAALAGVFVYGRRRQERELRESR
jgi:uncharacterized membrane protein